MLGLAPTQFGVVAQLRTLGRVDKMESIPALQKEEGPGEMGPGVMVTRREEQIGSELGVLNQWLWRYRWWGSERELVYQQPRGHLLPSVFRLVQ